MATQANIAPAVTVILVTQGVAFDMSNITSANTATALISISLAGAAPRISAILSSGVRSKLTKRLSNAALCACFHRHDAALLAMRAVKT